MPKNQQTHIAFVEELKSKNILGMLPKMDGWVFGEEVNKTWHEDGLVWKLQSRKMTHPEYRLSCGSKECHIFLVKDFPDKVPKIIEGDYVFTYIKTI